jgi:hypothetical protein
MLLVFALLTAQKPLQESKCRNDTDEMGFCTENARLRRLILPRDGRHSPVSAKFDLFEGLGGNSHKGSGVTPSSRQRSPTLGFNLRAIADIARRPQGRAATPTKPNDGKSLTEFTVSR